MLHVIIKKNDNPSTKLRVYKMQKTAKKSSWVPTTHDLGEKSCSDNTDGPYLSLCNCEGRVSVALNIFAYFSGFNKFEEQKF